MCSTANEIKENDSKRKKNKEKIERWRNKI
jgi:hypothetical protein